GFARAPLLGRQVGEIVARRTRRAKDFWTKRKVRGLVGVVFVLWVVIAYEIPVTTYGQWLGTNKLTTSGTYTLHIPGLPAVKYSAIIDYSVTGDFSVGMGNPIYMRALVYDANRSDFRELFAGIGLLFQALPIGPGGVAQPPFFQPAGQGNWTASGMVAFSQQINYTGPVLNPANLPKNASSADIISAVNSQVKAYDYAFPQLRPQSYTNSLSGYESAFRYAAMGSAIVLVFLIPVFDKTLLPKKDEEVPMNGATRRGGPGERRG
ncbi:MAG: hypothetical protein OK454_03740, partial [Thaumarchaeota archaeon]|nr:hypothetical protein [Nitrososphaerota archaeon]